MSKEFKYLKKHKALVESKKTEKVNEEVLVVNDGELLKVSKVIDIPKKIVNALVKKAKDESGKDPRVFWNDVAIAEEIVKYIVGTYLNNESLPASILLGDTSLSKGGSEEVEGTEGAEDVEGVEDAEGAEGEELPDDLELDQEGEEGAEGAEGEETAGEDVPSLDSEVSDDEATDGEEAEADETEEV